MPPSQEQQLPLPEDGTGPAAGRGTGSGARRRGEGPGPATDDGVPDAPVLGHEEPPGGGVRPAPVVHGRAGRDLRAAIGVGVVLAALVLGSVLLLPAAAVVLVLVAVAIGCREVVGALRAGGAQPPLLPVVAAGTTVAAASWFAGPRGLAAALLVVVTGLLGLAVVAGPRRARRDLGAAVLPVVYVGALAGFLLLLLQADDGAARLLLAVAATAANDIGGYATGVLSGGRHKMAPSVSPGKSWEGFAGSVAATALVTALWFPLALDASPLAGALLGVLLAAAGTVGDLGMSVLKRDVGVKDTGRLLPGHGGLMDRLDSLLVVAPVLWVGLLALAPPV